MNIVDLIVVGAVIAFAWSGWRQGFVGATLSFIGFLGGGLLGAFLAPLILGQLNVHGPAGLALTVGLVLGLAVVGQIGMSILGRSLNEKITWHPARMLDHVGGAVINVLALAVIGWILASTATALPSSTVAAEVRGSTLLANLDRVVPNQARDFVGGLRGLVNDSGLPELFDGFGVLPPAPIEAPTVAVVKNPAVQAALQSVVRVEGNAPSCESAFTGSGFVIAPNRVLTNAHVVAGVPHPNVHVPGVREALEATTVYFDSRVDVAVLDVPDLHKPVLSMAATGARGDDAIIAGYPGGGPMTATAARIRGVISSQLAKGTDIYGNPGVAREIYSLRGTARPGNSGGPLLAPNGSVYGVVFAQAAADPQTAYALTDNEVASAVAAGKKATHGVSVGRCSK